MSKFRCCICAVLLIGIQFREPSWPFNTILNGQEGTMLNLSLVQNFRNSSALAMELLRSSTKQSILACVVDERWLSDTYNGRQHWNITSVRQASKEWIQIWMWFSRSIKCVFKLQGINQALLSCPLINAIATVVLIFSQHYILLSKNHKRQDNYLFLLNQ